MPSAPRWGEGALREDPPEGAAASPAAADIAPLQRLLVSRVLIVTILLGINVFVDVKGTRFLADISLRGVYGVVALTYILSIVHVFLAGRIRSRSFHLYLLSLVDVALVTGLVFVTGGSRSVYSVLYPLIIIYTVLFLGRRGGLVIASACGLLYGILVVLEQYGWIYLPAEYLPDYDMGTGQILSRILIHVLSFYIIALLASFVVEQERKTRTLLREKQSAFDRLDLLHRSIIQSVNAGILTVDLQGQIKSFNRAASEITGFTVADVENRFIEDVFPGFREIRGGPVDGAPGREHRRHGEIALRRRQGGSVDLGCSISPLRDAKEGRIGDILIFQDLTHIKRMEAALEKSRRLAVVGEMAASLAHEIRNPLATISGSIQVLQNDLSLSESDRRLMQIILRGKDQIETFLRDFLLLARPVPGRRELVAPGRIMEEVLESIRFVPEWKDGIRLQTALAETPRIRANPVELRQVCWNVVLNALQAMPEEGELTVAVAEGVDASRPSVEIRVADTGVGIPPADRERIFEPFYTTREKGTGLGLAVVQRIVESYGGTVRIADAPEAGTVCTLVFPAERT